MGVNTHVLSDDRYAVYTSLMRSSDIRFETHFFIQYLLNYTMFIEYQLNLNIRHELRDPLISEVHFQMRFYCIIDEVQCSLRQTKFHVFMRKANRVTKNNKLLLDDKLYLQIQPLHFSFVAVVFKIDDLNRNELYE